ncbi:hypothetical protein L7F22_019027 [Adiantum nelumboides]|nr:hypothetical protein [Adiantum nelumboides]
MALSASIHETGISLEDELAEATKDLLDLGNSKQAVTKLIKNENLPLPSPSPLFLSRPGSSNRLDVSKALSIDPNARLTPIHDDNILQGKQDNLKLEKERTQERFLNSLDFKNPSQSQIRDENLPSSNLHGSVKSVSADLLAPLVRKSATSSPGLQAVQDTLRQHSWLNQYGERITSQGKIERRMDLFNARVYPASAGPSESKRGIIDLTKGSESAGLNLSRGSQQDHIPAFFQESFPEWVNNGEIPQQDDLPSSPKKREIESSTSEVSPSHGVPGHRLRLSQPSSAIATQTSVTVKLHGNKRAERQAMLNGAPIEDDQYFTGQTILASSNPSSSSPIQEIAPNPTNDDNTSLMSLPATTMTSSSNTSSARRRRSLARRRSNGSQSYMTGGSGEDGLNSETSISPFARDVHIRGFSIVGERARGYVAYDVRIVTHAGSTIGVLKRFSAFVNLRKALMEECRIKLTSKDLNTSMRNTGGNLKSKGQHRPIPQLPPRRSGILQKYASDHLEKRRRALQKWLAIVMLDPMWGTTHAVRQFVVGTDDV